MELERIEEKGKNAKVLSTEIPKELNPETFFLYSQELACIHRCQKVECILASFVRTLLYMQIERWPCSWCFCCFLPNRLSQGQVMYEFDLTLSSRQKAKNDPL
jgi:hypothetical protein